MNKFIRIRIIITAVFIGIISCIMFGSVDVNPIPNIIFIMIANIGQQIFWPKYDSYREKNKKSNY